jgi:hypothetical protein
VDGGPLRRPFFMRLYGVSYEGGMVTLLRDHAPATGENMVTQP